MPLAPNPVKAVPTHTSTAPTTSAVSVVSADAIIACSCSYTSSSLYLPTAESGAPITGPISLLGLLVVAIAALAAHF